MAANRSCICVCEAHVFQALWGQNVYTKIAAVEKARDILNCINGFIEIVH